MLRPRRDRVDSRAEFRVLLGGVLWAGLAGAIALLVLAQLLSSPLSGLLSVLAIGLPALLTQDALRYGFFAQGRPGAALVNDLVWLSVQAVLFAAILGGLRPVSSTALLAAWAVGAYVAVGVGLRQARVCPPLSHPTLWVRRHRRQIASFLADFLVMTGAAQLALVFVGVLAGLPALAGLRAAQLLFLPFHTTFASLRIMLMPVLAGVADGPTRVLLRRARFMAGCAAVAAVAYALPMALLPDAAGKALFGATWPAAEPLVWALAIVCLARTVSIPVVDALRALGGGRRLVTIRLTSSALLLVSVCGLAAVFGARGAAAGLALSAVVAAALWWWGLWRVCSIPVPPGQRPGHGSDKAAVPGR